MIFPVWLALLPTLAEAFQFQVQRFNFIAKENVLHNATQHHTPKNAGNLTADYDGTRDVCASYCTFDVDCDAFYLEEKDTGNCHLVDEDVTPDLMPFVGHGWRLPNVYFVKNKVSTGGVGAFDIDEELIPPCDSDDTEMTPGECAALPTDPMKYYKCSDALATYVDSVVRISDMKCPGEDRLLQCELDGREVNSNINLNRKELFRYAFEKTHYFPQGFIMEDDPLEFVAVTFKYGPRKLSRIILRTIRNGNEHMRDGTISIYGTQPSPDVLSYSFTQIEDCALHINFATAPTPQAAAAFKVDLKPLNWFGFDKHGFKWDIFIEALTTA